MENYGKLVAGTLIGAGVGALAMRWYDKGSLSAAFTMDGSAPAPAGYLAVQYGPPVAARYDMSWVNRQGLPLGSSSRLSLPMTLQGCIGSGDLSAQEVFVLRQWAARALTLVGQTQTSWSKLDPSVQMILAQKLVNQNFVLRDARGSVSQSRMFGTLRDYSLGRPIQRNYVLA